MRRWGDCSAIIMRSKWRLETNELGDDPMYLSGKTSATFVRSELNANGKTVAYLTVRLKWTTSLLTVTITGKTSDLWHSALIPILAQVDDGNTTTSISGTADGVVDFDVVSAVFNGITITGSVVTKPATAKDGSEVILSNIKIKGTGTGN